MMLLATLLFTLTAQPAWAGAYDVLYAVVSDTDNDGVNETMTLKCASSFPSGNNRYQYNQHWNWAESFRAPITTITVDASCANYTGTTLNGLFYRFANATVINDLDKLRTDDVTNMQDVFQYCQKVTTLDGINAWNTAKVTTMQNLFYNCRAVTKLDLSGWNTAAVTDMSFMFTACVELLSLDLSGWNTANVTTMSDMFGSCKKLTTLDLADFNTASVTDMTVMFDGCSGLQTILVGSGWTTANLTNGNNNNMFRSCSVTLTGGNGTKWNSSNIDATYAVVDGLNSQSGYLTGEWTLFNTGDDADHAYVIGSKALFDLFSRRVNAGNSYAGKYFKLGANLTYNKYYANIFTPIGTKDNPFSGTFDGDGKTISGINISLGTTDYVGLFGCASGATIKNLTVANSTISGQKFVGAILGSSHTDNNATIENCLVTSDVTVSGTEYVGGIVGNKANITGCASAATVSGDSRVGGIIGNGYQSIVTNCLYTGNSVSGNSYVGAIMGNVPSGTPNCNYNYYTADLTIGGFNGADTNGARKAVVIDKACGVTFTPTGTATTYNVSGITAYSGNSLVGYGGNFYAGHNEEVNLDITYASPYEGFSLTGYTDGVGSPATALTYVSGTTYTLTMPATVPTVTPDGRDLWGEMFSGRDGLTAATAYLITTTEGLDLLAKKVNGTDGYTVNNYSGKFFELGEDITYDNTQENNYTAIGTYTSYSVNQPFCGKFDGKGHTVSGIRINKTAYYQGLFGYINGAEVKNLIIDDATITIGSGNNCAGGIAGFSALSTIENCHATSTVTVIAQTGGTNGTDVGGIVGRNATNTGTISGCTSAATVSGNSYVGAIVGRNMYATIKNCLVLDANVTADDVAGAIAGMNSGTLTNNRYIGTTGGGVNGGDITDNGGATVAYAFPTDIDNFADVVGTAADTYGTGDYQGITAYKLNDTYTALAYNGKLYYPSLWTGTGASASDPYVIYTPEGLDKLANDVNGGNKYKNKHIALGHDIVYDKTALTIDFNDDGTNDSNFRGIGDETHEYYGNFDGRGHTISGLVINKTKGNKYNGPLGSNYNVGLFGINTSEYVRNLTVANSDITGQNEVGAIVGGTTSKGLTIENCHVASDVTVSGYQFVGGISGNDGNVKGCTSAATVSGSSSIGGIVGYIKSSDYTVINNLYLGNSVTLAGTSYSFGAIIGANAGSNNVANNYHTAYGLGGVYGANTNGAQFAVSSTTKPDGIGDEGTTYGTGTYTGITPYTSGLYYNGRYYWHDTGLVVLEDQSTTNTTTISSNNDNQTHNVVLAGRTLYRDGYWNTLCLPFDVTVGSDVMADATAMTLNTSTSGFYESTGELTLNFDAVTSGNTIDAGTPFIVKWGTKDSHPDTDITNPVFTDVTIGSTTPTLIKSTDTNVGFIGNYNRVTLTGGDASNLYLGVKDGKNTLFWPSSDRQINAFRAYFIIYPLQSGGGQAPELKIVLNFGEEGENTTGIIEVNTNNTNLTNKAEGVFDLQGRRIANGQKPTAKGLYIVNGKKVVIK